MFWLGNKRGYLTDWITQKWVQLTGRRVDLNSTPWLEGPIAPTTGIGSDYFSLLSLERGLEIVSPNGENGIIADFGCLRGSSFDPDKVHPAVGQFYERTMAYEMDAWAEWSGIFRPFGWLLAVLFSRRLQQLNVPLSALDTSKGVSNEVIQFVNPATKSVELTAWLRKLHGTGHVLYAGFYSVCRIPGHAAPCVKVVFPLPNGNAVVIMRTECQGDSFVIISAGKQFGDPGFYFTVHDTNGGVRARYVRSLQESIHLYAGGDSLVRADHVLKYFGVPFLKIHYRLKLRSQVMREGEKL